jgi:two-component system, response regulator PdtaR
MKSQRMVIVAEAKVRAEAKQVTAAIGCNVVGEANNPEDGLRLIRRVQPDLILLEAGGRGITLLDILGVEAVAPVVVVLSVQEQSMLDRVVEAGALGVIFKPFSALDLATVLTVAVHNYKKQGQLQQKYRQLEEEVELRKLVDRAKGKLMTAAGISEAEAYRWLQKTSMDTQSSLKKVANDVLKGRIEFK